MLMSDAAYSAADRYIFQAHVILTIGAHCEKKKIVNMLRKDPSRK